MDRWIRNSRSWVLLVLVFASGCFNANEPTATPSQQSLGEIDGGAEGDDSNSRLEPSSFESPELVAGVYTRMPLTADALRSIIKNHNLKQIAADSLDAEFFLRYYPSHWPSISIKQSKWYAWPYNQGEGDSNLQVNYTLAVDQSSATLFLLEQNYDVTP